MMKYDSKEGDWFGDEDCPFCGEHYDEVDYEYQICHHCGMENNREEKQVRKFLRNMIPGRTVKVYHKDKPSSFGIIKDVVVVKKKSGLREMALLEPCDEVGLLDIDYFLNECKVIIKNENGYK